MGVLRHTCGLAGVGLIALWAADVGADPLLRHQADQLGDVVVLGSTLATDCAASVLQPPGATVSCSGQVNVDDTAPDLYFRDNLANASISSLQARSSATLTIPTSAKVTYARLYWSALKDGNMPDTTAVLDWKGGPIENVTADATWVQSYGFASHPSWYYYQASADVTTYIDKWGPGDYRVTDVESLNLSGVEVDRAFSAWTLVVFYEDQSAELRNLALFDGFTPIDPGFPGQEKAEVTLAGFLVPPGFSAKMTAFAYEGDAAYTGDDFTFNSTKLSNASNDISNFFNSSRSYLGTPLSGSMDEPKLSGAVGSMSGYDLDTADVTSLVSAGDKSAKVGASSSLDIFFLGGFVTSITNKAPDFNNLVKSAEDLNGGALLPGDVVEYTISGKNSGNDPAINTVLTDQIDAGLEFVPGSMQMVAGGTTGSKTDALDADQAHYDSAMHMVNFRLGTGASGSAGGTVAVGQPITVKFRAKVLAQSGTIPNQGFVSAAGQSGTPAKVWPSDGDPLTVGAQPTVVTVRECNTDADCPANKPHCDASKVCVPCASDADCGDPAMPACQADGSCAECSSSNQSQCSGLKPACNTFNGSCAPCDPAQADLSAECSASADGKVCLPPGSGATDPFCGCTQDSDCGGPMSGRVCDTASTQKCIDGCRGQGGNGCPSALSCTSMDSNIGQCVPPGQGSGGMGAMGGSAGMSGSGNGMGGSAGNNGQGSGGSGAVDDSGDDGSCGCRLANNSTPSGAWLAGLGLVLAVGWRRGRRRPSRSR